MLSKTIHIRERLVEAGMVQTLIRLSKSEAERVRISCSEALKNLSSSGGDGIEEGTVSTLISMSLSGANTNTTTITVRVHALVLVEKNSNQSHPTHMHTG